MLRRGLALFSLSVTVGLIVLLTYQRNKPHMLWADSRLPEWAVTIICSTVESSEALVRIGTGSEAYIEMKAVKPEDEVPPAPSAGRALMAYARGGRLALGYITISVDAHERGWRCTYSGASLLLIHIWIPIVAFALIGVAGVVPIWRLVLHWNRKRLGLCTRCGYPSKGLVIQRCPECGKSFAGK